MAKRKDIIKYNIFSLLILVLFSLFMSFFIGDLFGWLLKTPDSIVKPIKIFIFAVFVFYFRDKITPLGSLFIKIKSFKYLYEFILFVIIFYVFLIAFFGMVYYIIAITSNKMSNFYEWIYFSIITICTVGYGDITPINGLMRIIVSFEALIGLLSPPLLISIGLSLIFNENKK